MAMLSFLIWKARILFTWPWKLEDHRQKKEGPWSIFECFTTCQE